MRGRTFILLPLIPLVLVACSDDDDNDLTVVGTGSTPVAASSAPGAATGTPPVTDTANAVTVLASDYRYDNLPDAVESPTTFSLRNDSTAEVHEMVVIRIPDEETRTVGQLINLPDEEIDQIFGEAPPALVIVALPGEMGNNVLGDGVLRQPGRYAVLCFIPVGADPHAAMTAMSDPDATGVPGDGPPHITEGMYGEVVVE